jgi:hypothetical protein
MARTKEQINAYHRDLYASRLEEQRARGRAFYRAHKEEARAKYLAHREEKLAYGKTYREANKEKLSAQRKVYYYAHQDKFTGRSRAWYHANKDRARATKRAKLYGITGAEFQALLDSQDGRCAHCGTNDFGWKGPCVDHDHMTGKVRWIVCNTCNRAMGLLKENIFTMQRMIENLRKANICLEEDLPEKLKQIISAQQERIQ